MGNEIDTFLKGFGNSLNILFFKPSLKSEDLRGQVSSMIETSCSEVMMAWSQTNKAFEDRILETETAVKKNEENVEKTNAELSNLDYNIKMIKNAIKEKKNPLKVRDQ